MVIIWAFGLIVEYLLGPSHTLDETTLSLPFHLILLSNHGLPSYASNDRTSYGQALCLWH